MKDFSSYSYDKAKWHYGGDEFPAELSEIHGFTHTGFYLLWLAENNFISDFVRQDFEAELSATLNRDKSPVHLYEMMDGCLIGDMLNSEGNMFSQSYYEKHYLNDYSKTYDEVTDVYYVNPSWENYERIVPLISQRFQKWQRSKVKKPWQF